MIIRYDSYLSNVAVSCSIIVYNQKEWIERCLEGVFEQEFAHPFNIVISDDCSTDGTQDVLHAYQQRYPTLIKLVLNEQNGGIAANWSNCCKALENCKYIAFCDGDDYWSYPQKLQLQYDYMEGHPECSGMTSACDEVDEYGKIVKRAASECAKDGKDAILPRITQKQIWKDPIPINSGGFFFRKDIFDSVMPLDAFVEQDFPYQDWPALLIMAGYGEIHYLPIATFAYRIGHASDSHSDDISKLERRMTRGANMYYYLHTLFPTLEWEKGIYEKYADNVLLRFAIKSNNYRKAKYYAKKIPQKTIREISCYTMATFQLYRWLKQVRHKGLKMFKGSKV